MFVISLRPVHRFAPKLHMSRPLQLSLSNSFTTEFRRSIESIFECEYQPNPKLVNAQNAPADYDQSAVVYDHFISDVECEAIVKDVMSKMKRRRYEKGHWDAVITDYKEVELRLPLHPAITSSRDENFASSSKSSSIELSPTSCKVIEKVHSLIRGIYFDGESSVKFLPSHAIQLRGSESQLNAHVDSVRFSGRVVAGLSLCSPSIMRLKPASASEIANAESLDTYQETDAVHHEDNVYKSVENAGHVDLYLPIASLYILSGMSRYTYTHELLPSGSSFNDEINHVERSNRISIIFRDAFRQKSDNLN